MYCSNTWTKTDAEYTNLRFTTLCSIRRLLVGDESDGNRQDVFLNMFGDALVERIPASIVPRPIRIVHIVIHCLPNCHSQCPSPPSLQGCAASVPCLHV